MSPDEWQGAFQGDDYQARFDLLAASGQDVHGEATFVRAYSPASVLDAGCGTGRVAIELARGGLDASVIRPMGIYGPGDPGRFLMLYRAVRRGRFLMFGDGETFYHPCYIDNLVDAFELAAEHPKAVGGTTAYVGFTVG